MRALCCILLLLLATPASAFTVTSQPDTIIRVIDGDTIEIDDVRIRLLAIDTPETFRSRCSREHQLGFAAKVRLEQLLAQQPVSYQSDGELDRYNRLLANVYAGGQDVGAVLLEEGFALRYEHGSKAKLWRMRQWCP